LEEVRPDLLTKQPNWYFVLNGIFCSLEEETAESGVGGGEDASTKEKPAPLPVSLPGPVLTPPQQYLPNLFNKCGVTAHFFAQQLHRFVYPP